MYIVGSVKKEFDGTFIETPDEIICLDDYLDKFDHDDTVMITVNEDHEAQSIIIEIQRLNS